MSLFFASWEAEFIRHAESRVNVCTGEMIPLPRWVRRIDPEDLDWFLRQWEEEDWWDALFDYDLKAGTFHGKPVTGP